MRFRHVEGDYHWFEMKIEPVFSADQVIIQMSKRILNTVRDMDTVGRLGGDEFIILLPEIKNKENLTSLIRRLEQNLQTPYQIESTLCG